MTKAIVPAFVLLPPAPLSTVNLTRSILHDDCHSKCVEYRWR